MKRVIVIGSGFSSLSAASYLAKEGFEVSIFEKNDTPGGRARQLKRDGFTFDMGPSWYWMPDIFENFFKDFGKTTSDFYELERLDPGYQIYFKDKLLKVYADLDKLCETFEEIEVGSGKKLAKFIAKAKENYEIAIGKVVMRPGKSPLELVTPETAVRVGQFLRSVSDVIQKDFKDEALRAALEFPVLFLGAKPENTPSFYIFMNYADYGLGTWHPKGGMYEIVKAMVAIAESNGVKIHTSSAVSEIKVSQSGKAEGIILEDGSFYEADFVVSGADYHHSETLLPQKYRQYSEEYWAKRTFAPSSLLFYVGFNKKLDGTFAHHNLFFDTDFKAHASDIYDKPNWPKEPLFYANFPSASDESMAPKGKETGFFLIPIAPGIKDTQKLRDKYFDKIIERLEDFYGEPLKDHIEFTESFCVNDFVSEYNSYKGNAYGLANTLRQTAFLRPKLASKKVSNLFFTGQLTVPGPGVPPALISGKIVSELLLKQSV
jgi:phytoene desaturase